jgi:hypothetical protein
MALEVAEVAAAPVSINDALAVAPKPGAPPPLPVAPLPPLAFVVAVVGPPEARENVSDEVAWPPLPAGAFVPPPPFPPVADWFNVMLPDVLPVTALLSEAAPPAPAAALSLPAPPLPPVALAVTDTLPLVDVPETGVTVASPPAPLV